MTAARRLRAVPDVPRRGIGILRVSKVGKRAENLISPELQQTAIETYVASRGIEIIDWVPALDESASRSRSAWWPKLDKQIERVEAGEADVIVAWEFSRHARNRLRWAVALDRVETAGGTMESATEPVDVTTAAGRFQRGVFAEMHAYRAEAIGEGWKAVQDRRIAAGLPHSALPRAGYIVEHGRYTPDPEVGPLVAEAYRRYTRGGSLQEVADWLTSVGVRTRFGRAWDRTAISRMMDGGFAAGLLRIHDPDCTTRHPDSDSLGACTRKAFIPGAHDPLISPEEWAAYQASRDARAVVAPRLLASVTPLSGVGRCGSCGRALVYMKERDGRSARLACATAECKRRAGRPYSVIEAAVLDWLPTVAARFADPAASAVRPSAAEKVTKARLQRTVTDAARALAQLTVDHAKRVVPTSAYETARDQLLAEQRAAQAELDRLTRADALQADHAATAARLLEIWGTAEAEEIAPLLRGLCTVWLTRRDGARGCDVAVYGDWETLPEPTRPPPRVR